VVLKWLLNIINKGVVRSVIEKIRLCRDRGYARYIPPLKVRGLKRLRIKRCDPISNIVLQVQYY
jgi:hypothetical protein